MKTTFEHLVDLVRVQLSLSVDLRILPIMLMPHLLTRLLLAALPHLPYRAVHVRLVVRKQIDLLLELLNLGQIIRFDDGLPFWLMPQFKTLNDLLQSLPLLLLLGQLSIGDLEFVQHLVETLFHLLLTF